MKKIIALSAILAVFACSVADAAMLRKEQAAPGNISLFLDGEADNGQFDTIIVDVKARPGVEFLNINESGVDGFTPLAPGADATFVNALLSAPPAFGGNGFSILGQEVTSTSVAFTGGPLGGTIDTVNGPNVGPNGLFLGNFVLSPGGVGDATVQLVRGGSVIAELSAVVPEPATLALASLSLVALACGRRRS